MLVFVSPPPPPVFHPAGVPQGFLMEPLFFSVFFINHRVSAGSSPGIFLKHSVSESG